MKYTLSVKCEIEVEIPDGLTRDQAEVLVANRLSNVDGIDGIDWEWGYIAPAFALTQEMDPKHPIWIETSQGLWAISGTMMIRQEFELPDGFVMDAPWRTNVPLEKVEHMFKQLDRLSVMGEHQGYFNSWVQPLSAMGLDAVGLCATDIAWLTKDGDVVALVMPCLARSEDIGLGLIHKFRDLAGDRHG